MNEQDKQALIKKISEELKIAQRDIADLEEQTKPISPENSIGRISRMDAINNKAVNEASLRKTKLKLNNLEMALNKIDAQGFGICTRCKNPIQPARLMYMPESTRCVHCAD